MPCHTFLQLRRTETPRLVVLKPWRALHLRNQGQEWGSAVLFVRFVLVLTLAAASSTVGAVVAPLTFEPATIREGESIVVVAKTAGCTIIAWEAPLDREIDISGNVVTITAMGINKNESTDVCTYGPGTTRLQFGPLTTGHYVVVLKIRDLEDPTKVSEAASATIQVLPAQPVPASSDWSRLALACAVSLLGFFAIRSRI